MTQHAPKEKEHELDISLDGGKYRYLFHHSGHAEALRYGKPWRDFVGDGFVLAMAYRVDELEVALAKADAVLSNVQEMLAALIEEKERAVKSKGLKIT